MYTDKNKAFIFPLPYRQVCKFANFPVFQQRKMIEVLLPCLLWREAPKHLIIWKRPVCQKKIRSSFIMFEKFFPVFESFWPKYLPSFAVMKICCFKTIGNNKYLWRRDPVATFCQFFLFIPPPSSRPVTYYLHSPLRPFLSRLWIISFSALDSRKKVHIMILYSTLFLYRQSVFKQLIEK